MTAEFLWLENGRAGSPLTLFHSKQPTEVLDPGAGSALSIVGREDGFSPGPVHVL